MSHLFLLAEKSFTRSKIKIIPSVLPNFRGHGKRKEYRGQQLGAAWAATVHCKKRLTIFLSPAGMSLTKLSAGEGKIANIFLQCTSIKYLLSETSVLPNDTIPQRKKNGTATWQQSKDML
jgi:hypothetical protein